MKNLFLMALILLVTACGQNTGLGSSKLDGTYTSIDGRTVLIFNANGKVKWGNNEIDYKIDGDKVALQGVPVVLTLNEDSKSLDGGVVLGKLIKH